MQDGKMCGDGGCCGGDGKCGNGIAGMPLMHGRHHGGKHMLLGLLAIALIVWVGLKARNEAREFDYIGVPVERNVISVSGEGKVVGKPDVATIDLGTVTERQTVAAAQQENNKVMDQLIAKLKEAGIESKDIQTTSYNVFPNYDWTNNRQVLRSYSVTQNVHVKIRDLAKIGDIIGMAGTLGANQIGGIAFTVDEPEALKAEAREKAIKDAREKAEALAKATGIKLDRIVSFSESQGGGVPPIYYDKAVGMGGAEAVRNAPTIEAGSSEYVVNVNISYEIH